LAPNAESAAALLGQARYGEAIALECLGDVCALEQRAGDATEAWAPASVIFEALGDDARALQVRGRLAGARTQGR
jgi:hypothetical protein